MSNIVRAWKDEAYRQSLSAEEQALLPTNPAGEIELTEADLDAIWGASADDSGQTNPDGNRIITYNPVLGGSSVTVLGSTSNPCNNVGSPNIVSVIGPYQARP